MRIKTTTNNNETGEKSLDNIKKAIDGFNENIAKIISQPVTQEELERAKKTLKSEILYSIEMNSDRNAILSDHNTSPYGIDYINKEFEIIDTITTQDILNTAQNVFSGKPVYSISGTKEALDFNKGYLENLNNF